MPDKRILFLEWPILCNDNSDRNTVKFESAQHHHNMVDESNFHRPQVDSNMLTIVSLPKREK